MIHFNCSCGNRLFFDNSKCLQCGRSVGFDLATHRMTALDQKSTLRLCDNGVKYAVCNWLIPVSQTSGLCHSCKLTRTLPDLGVAGQLDAWHRMELEKRRVLYTMSNLGIVPLSKMESPLGLAFDFLAPVGGAPVVTGHMDGVITLNVFEADDGYRENERRNLREPYRTLLGHFRHELGHYIWDCFFRGCSPDDPRIAAFREKFGDERADYAGSLAKHYQNGPIAGWQSSFVTAYAAVHPWEDWAETCAHYLHIVDAVETVESFGWRGESVPMPGTPFTSDSVGATNSAGDQKFLQTLNKWARMSPALNEIAASLGNKNLFPFALLLTPAQKIFFVHRTIASGIQAGFASGSTNPEGQSAARPASANAIQRQF